MGCRVQQEKFKYSGTFCETNTLCEGDGWVSLFQTFLPIFSVKRTCIYTSDGVKVACVASVEMGGR